MVNAELAEVLKALGDSPKEIADNLTAKGIKGFLPVNEAYDSAGCPLANYVKSLGFNDVTVNGLSIQHDQGLIWHTRASREFIQAFDNEEFPQLIER